VTAIFWIWRTTAFFFLALDGTIVFWNRGAEEMYGWSAEQALGKISHRSLHTRFPYALDRIMRQLEETGHWAGELIHRTRDRHQIAGRHDSNVEPGRRTPLRLLENRSHRTTD
jgi:PAS domain S-box-containing protein